ncbi:MAG: type 1 glutamine amidotransferase [Pseudobdellovibrionaceae bacterium]
MPQFLILQHATSTPAGSTLLWLKERDLSYHHLMTPEIQDWSELPAFDNLVICGGAMDVDQEEQYPWLKSEKKLIQETLANSAKKTLGLCLGAQLIAEALGASVHKHDHWEVGWQPVNLFPEASQGVLPETTELKVFQYHGYRFHLPEGAVRLAQNHACSDQGFLWKDRAVGFQFHPESTQEWIDFCATDKSEIYPTGEFVQPADDLLKDQFSQPKLQNWYFNFLDRFFSVNL